MKTAAIASLTCLLWTAAAFAEVSVDHQPDGGVVLFFQPGPDGPWDRVRPDVPVADVLNEDGDADGHSWPQVTTNVGNQRPDVVWSTDGDDPEILFSTHDGTAWVQPVNVSSAEGTDHLASIVTDSSANRYVAWGHTRNGKSSVRFLAICGEDEALTEMAQLSPSRNGARRPALALHVDDFVYVAYEEAPNGPDDSPLVAIDQISVDKDPGTGYVVHGGADHIDVARIGTYETAHSDPDDSSLVTLHAEAEHLWLTWRNDEGQLAWVEYTGDGQLSEPEYAEYETPAEEAEALEAIRQEVLGG